MHISNLSFLTYFICTLPIVRSLPHGADISMTSAASTSTTTVPLSHTTAYKSTSTVVRTVYSTKPNPTPTPKTIEEIPSSIKASPSSIEEIPSSIKAPSPPAETSAVTPAGKTIRHIQARNKHGFHGGERVENRAEVEAVALKARKREVYGLEGLA